MKKKTISPVMKNSQAVMNIINSDKGVLLLHGFKGSPYEMKYLGEKILKQGYSVCIPRLPGHGTVIDDMTDCTGKDWETSAHEALVELKSHCREVYIVGLSMGGIITLILAGKYSIKKIALLSVPRSIKEKSIYLTPVLGVFKKILKEEDVTRGLASIEARKIHEGYSTGIPLKQSWYLFKLIKKAMKALSGINVSTEVLLIQSINDQVIPADSINYIYSKIPCENKEKVILERSNHAITVDIEKEIVAEEVIAFLQR